MLQYWPGSCHTSDSKDRCEQRSSQQSADDGRDPKEPALRGGPPADKYCRPGAARWIH